MRKPFLAAAPAHACSVSDTCRVSTNIELVDGADLILIGHIEDGPVIESVTDPAALALSLARFQLFCNWKI